MEHCFERHEFPKKSLRVLAHHKNVDGSSALFAKRWKSCPCFAWRTTKLLRPTARPRCSQASRRSVIPKRCTFGVLPASPLTQWLPEFSPYLTVAERRIMPLNRAPGLFAPIADNNPSYRSNRFSSLQGRLPSNGSTRVVWSAPKG